MAIPGGAACCFPRGRPPEPLKDLVAAEFQLVRVDASHELYQLESTLYTTLSVLDSFPKLLLATVSSLL